MTRTTKKRARIAMGCWHGANCYVLSRDHGTPDCILAGGYTEDEALEARRMMKNGEPPGRYADDIVCIEDPSEWREQNS